MMTFPFDDDDDMAFWATPKAYKNCWGGTNFYLQGTIMQFYESAGGSGTEIGQIF